MQIRPYFSSQLCRFSGGTQTPAKPGTAPAPAPTKAPPKPAPPEPATTPDPDLAPRPGEQPDHEYC